jgi:shikimate dehydrogenase
MRDTELIRLGLIGDNIKPSRAPYLHRLAGELCGLNVSYDLLIPNEMDMEFDQILTHCAAVGYRGVNVTYPYKEWAVTRAEVDDPLIRRIGSLNTIAFDSGRMQGYNTDYTGFISAFLQRFPNMPPGLVTIIGAGGVGKAVAFGLVVLGASEIRIVDRDADKAGALASSLNEAVGRMLASHHLEIHTAIEMADGVLNCTPIGMVGYPGTPVARQFLASLHWAFDAVYTPVETRFKSDAESAGAKFMSGYELFFNQGIQAFRIFTGREPQNLAQLHDLLTLAG